MTCPLTEKTKDWRGMHEARDSHSTSIDKTLQMKKRWEGQKLLLSSIERWARSFSLQATILHLRTVPKLKMYMQRPNNLFYCFIIFPNTCDNILISVGYRPADIVLCLFIGNSWRVRQISSTRTSIYQKIKIKNK